MKMLRERVSDELKLTKESDPSDLSYHSQAKETLTPQLQAVQYSKGKFQHAVTKKNVF